MSLRLRNAARMQFDSDAIAVLTAMNGPSATPARAVEINNLIVRLKAAGIWTLLDVMWVTAAQDPAAALINWKSPGTFNLTASGTLTFVGDRGFTGNGTTGRFGTGWIPSTNGVNYTVNDASLWSWALTDVAGTASDIGCLSDANANRAQLQTRTAGDRLNGWVNSSNNFQPVVATSVGLSGGSRAGAIGQIAWRNGVNVGNSAIASTARPTVEAFLNGANSGSFSTRQVAFGAFGASLTGLELTFYQILLLYMQAVGAA